MRIPWELLLIVVILAIVAVVTQQAAPERTTPPPPDLISDSSAPGGAKALHLWLQSLGYRVERMEHRAFQPDEATSVLFVLAPTEQPSKDDLDALRRWVERGGTLIAAGSTPSLIPELRVDRPVLRSSALPSFLSKFGLQLRPLGAFSAQTTPSQPLLLSPVVSNVRVEATSHISGPNKLVSYLGEPERPIAAGLAVGKGQIYVLASTYAFSNQGIGQADNAALLSNWLPAPSEPGSIAFDEIHHGRFEARSLAYVLTHEPWGWAVLYSLGIAFLYLLLHGRRFGRPVPSIVDTRRVASEYVVSLASLLRQGNKGDWAARHFEHALRRKVAGAWSLDPELDTPTVASRLAETDGMVAGVQGKSAGRTLLELRDGANSGISEAHLVRLAAEADRIIKACRGRRR